MYDAGLLVQLRSKLVSSQFGMCVDKLGLAAGGKPLSAAAAASGLSSCQSCCSEFFLEEGFAQQCQDTCSTAGVPQARPCV